MSLIAPPRIARIDMGALERNLRQLEPEIVDVRADAYGHGAQRVLRSAREHVPGLRGVIVSRAEVQGIAPELLSGLAISYADNPRAAGAALYGLETSVETRPVMTVSAQVILLKRIAAGEGVSYGGTYRPESDTVVALLAIGYSQGIARRASNRCEAFAAGTHCRIAGAISMDLVSVDVGGLTVNPGDHVELFGGNSRLTAWASETGITPLALSSRIQASVPRIEVHA